MSSRAENPMSSLPRKKNYAWIWFFAFVIVASVGVAAFMIQFNRALQLTPEKLAEAQARWKANGPADYLLTYTRHLGNSDNVDTFVVTVRQKRVVEVRMNGKLLRDEKDVPIADERLQYHSMDRLLRDIERFLEIDAKENRKNYNVAYFDEQTGALQKYTRSVRGGEHVVEEAKIEPLPP
jgi:hypothetical protein